MAFCSGFMGKIKSLFKKVDKFLDDNINTALAVSTAIRSFFYNPVFDVLVAISKTQVDNILLDKVRQALSVAVDSLAIVNTCKQYTSLEEKLQCFITEVKKLAPDLQQAILVKLAQLVASQIDGNRYKQSVYDALVQGKFTIEK